MHLLNFYQTKNNRKFIKSDEYICRSIDWIFRRIGIFLSIATRYRCAVIDARMIRHSSNLHERPIIEANYPVDRLF